MIATSSVTLRTSNVFLGPKEPYTYTQHRGRPKRRTPCPECGQLLTALEYRDTHACPPIMERRRQERIRHAVTWHLEWARGVGRLAYRYLPHSIDVQDVEQEAAIRLMKAAERYSLKRGDGYQRATPFRAFAYPVVFYGCLASYRGGKYRAETGEELTDCFACEDVGFAAVESSALSAAIARAESRLTSIQRAIVALHYAGMPLTQVAPRLGLSAREASNLHCAALAALRDELAEMNIRGVEDCL